MPLSSDLPTGIIASEDGPGPSSWAADDMDAPVAEMEAAGAAPLQLLQCALVDPDAPPAGGGSGGVGRERWRVASRLLHRGAVFSNFCKCTTTRNCVCFQAGVCTGV